MIFKNILILAALFLSLVQVAVNAQCAVGTKAFAPGEVLKYDAMYNWGLIWINAGEVEFNVSSKRYEGRDVYHFYSWGTSHKSYDWIFKVRQRYQAYADKETMRSLWYERNVVEGNYTAYEDYKFDYRNNEIRTHVQKRRNPGVDNTLPITPCLFDVLTAIYYFRSVDFSNYRPGDVITMNMILDSETYQLGMRFLGREEIRPRGRTRYNCLKFAVQLVAGSVFKEGEEAIIWVTDDKNKVPVMVEAPIIVGSVKAVLRETRGLKH